jgi:hypothetical protein
MQTMGIEVSATRTPELSQRAQARGRNAMDSPPKSGKRDLADYVRVTSRHSRAGGAHPGEPCALSRAEATRLNQ